MKNRIILLVVLIMAGMASGLQAGNRKANRYFELFRYSKAIPLYKKSAESQTGQVKREATERLADCYRLTGEIRESRIWYAKAIQYEHPDPILYYYYGQALRSLGQYGEAKNAFLEFSRLNPNDVRGKILAGYCDQIGSLPALPPSVRVENASLLNSSGSDFAPAFYRDGLVFASDRKTDPLDGQVYDWTNRGYLDVYFSGIQAEDNSWEAMTEPVRMGREFNQPYHDGPVCFTEDYNEAFITRTEKEKVSKDQNNIRTNLLKLYWANISGEGKPVFRPMPFNSGEYSTGHATVSGDGTFLVFSSDRPGGSGAGDLYFSRKSGETWSEPKNLGDMVNSFGNEVFPFLANDTTLYFASDGHLGFGGLDLYVSRLRYGSWSQPQNLLKPVNSPFDDFALVFRKGNGFFSSDRPGGAGSDDIYALLDYFTPVREAEPAPQVPVQQQLVSGFVREKQTGNPMTQATVFVLNSFTNEVTILKTKPNGLYSMPVSKGILYVAKAMSPGYLDDCLTFRFGEPDSAASLSAPRDLLLDKFSINQVFKLENIYYDLDKWFIREDAKPALDDLVRNMKQFPISIELSSHTDSRAPDEYNMLLSTRRAQAAVDYLVMNGIESSRLKARGYGETMLVNRCGNGVPCSEGEHQANRRTEFKILSVGTEKEQSGTFDPAMFIEGDLIPVQLLEAGFFKGCLQSGEKPIPEKVAPPVSVKADQTRVEPAVKKETAKEPSGIALTPDAVQAGNKQSWFAVQIYAITSLSQARKLDFKGETVYSKPVDKYTKYYVGRYTDWKTANKERLRLNHLFPGCFMVAFKEGEIVPVNELRKMLEK